MSDGWEDVAPQVVVDPNMHVRNTFVDIRQVTEKAVNASHSDPEHFTSSHVKRRTASPDSSIMRKRAVTAMGATPAGIDPAFVDGSEQQCGARPGRKERMRMKALAMAGPGPGPGTGTGPGPGPGPGPGLPMWLFLLGIVVVAGCAAAPGLLLRVWSPQVDIASPAKQIMDHSELLINRTEGADNASIATLQDKLKFKNMKIHLAHNLFTGTRDATKAFIRNSCELPEKICSTMMAAVDAREMKYHKKGSVPLDENEGSYNAVWMWLQQTERNDEVHLAFKGASMSYKLRDVVEYSEKIDEEPIIKCRKYIFLETCWEVDTKKTTTLIPVFKTTVMSPQEMQLVDTMMETMVAKKVLENTNPQLGKQPDAMNGMIAGS